LLDRLHKKITLLYSDIMIRNMKITWKFQVPTDGFISPMLYAPLFMGWFWLTYYYMHHSTMDGLDLSLFICPTRNGIDLIFQYYIHHPPRDGLDLLSAIYTTFHGMTLIFLVLYAPLYKGWTWSHQFYMHHSSRDIFDL
jgi:hypothetical protein